MSEPLVKVSCFMSKRVPAAKKAKRDRKRVKLSSAVAMTNDGTVACDG